MPVCVSYSLGVRRTHWPATRTIYGLSILGTLWGRHTSSVCVCCKTRKRLTIFITMNEDGRPLLLLTLLVAGYQSKPPTPSLPIETCNMHLIDAHRARLKGGRHPANISWYLWHDLTVSPFPQNLLFFLFLPNSGPVAGVVWKGQQNLQPPFMHTIRLPSIAFRLRNRFLLRQRFSNSLASSSTSWKTGMSGDILYFSCGLFCLPHHHHRSF